MARMDEFHRGFEVAKRFPEATNRMFGKIPEAAHHSAMEWVFFGVNLGGGFFQAIIANDLVEAFGRADSGNAARIHDYASWLFNDAPRNCWGSAENRSEWAERGGLFGMYKEAGCQWVTGDKWGFHFHTVQPADDLPVEV